MSWMHNENLEEAVVAMQPEKNFIYQQIEFDEQQGQYFYPPQPPISDYIAYNTDDKLCKSSRSVAMQEKLSLMNRIQLISHTKSYGEHATLSDWESSDNIEKETIGMMRHFGMFSLAEGNLDKNDTLPVTVQTKGVYISKNGKYSTPIVLEEAFFRPRRHNSGHRHFSPSKEFCYPSPPLRSNLDEQFCNSPPPLRSDLDEQFCNSPPPLRSDLDEQFCNPPPPLRSDSDTQIHGYFRPVPNNDREFFYPPKRVPKKNYSKQLLPPRGVVDNKSNPTHNSCDYEQYYNQPANNVIQKENFEPLHIISDMTEEQYKHPSEVLNKPRHSLISNSESISEPRLSGISQFNVMLRRNRTIRRPSRWHRQSLHPEASSAIDKVSKIVKNCYRKCCANMENTKIDPEAISAFDDNKAKNPQEAKRKRMMPLWSRAAEMKSTASSGSSNSDYDTARSSSSCSFFSAHSSSTWSNEETVNVEESGNKINKKLHKRILKLEKQSTDDIPKSQAKKKSKRYKRANQKTRLFGSQECLDLY